MQALLAGVDNLRILNEMRALKDGRQRGATQAWKAAKAALHRVYMEQLGLARIALRANTMAKTPM